MQENDLQEFEGQSEAEGLPYLRFYHSESLRATTLGVLDAVETAEDSTDHRQALTKIILELTRSGLAYYFMRPVQAADVGFVGEKSTEMGIASILKVMGPVTRRIIGGMDENQLRSVTSHIRHLMR